jgi:tRNA U34 5-methylaminomethyl-2-thiouridine-forming methyltransferase MnmC
MKIINPPWFRKFNISIRRRQIVAAAEGEHRQCNDTSYPKGFGTKRSF